MWAAGIAKQNPNCTISLLTHPILKWKAGHWAPHSQFLGGQSMTPSCASKLLCKTSSSLGMPQPLFGFTSIRTGAENHSIPEVFIHGVKLVALLLPLLSRKAPTQGSWGLLAPAPAAPAASSPKSHEKKETQHEKKKTNRRGANYWLVREDGAEDTVIIILSPAERSWGVPRPGFQTWTGFAAVGFGAWLSNSPPAGDLSLALEVGASMGTPWGHHGLTPWLLLSNDSGSPHHLSITILAFVRGLALTHLAISSGLGRSANKHPGKAKLGGRWVLPWLSILLGWGEKDVWALLNWILWHSLAHPPLPKILGASHPRWASVNRSPRISDWFHPMPPSPCKFLYSLCPSASKNTSLPTSFSFPDFLAGVALLGCCKSHNRPLSVQKK